MEQEDTTKSKKYTKKCNYKNGNTNYTIFLSIIGLIEPEELKALELVGVNKDTYLIYPNLLTEYDSRVSIMELYTKPTEKIFR